MHTNQVKTFETFQTIGFETNVLDTPSEGNSSSDWLGSIAEVIAAGPPFSDTITNSFRLKLNDLIAYTA